MRIAVIGASAGVGLEVVKLALERGHEVTSLSRRTDSLPEHPHLRKVQGSSTQSESVRLALQDADVILVTLGTGMSTKATTLYSDSARVVLQVLQESGAHAPLIALTGFGAGASWGYNSLIMKLFFRLLLKNVYDNKSEMERMITTAYPHWEMVRPGLLTNGVATGKYRVQDDLTKGMKVGSIARLDVAHFLVTEAEKPVHLGKYPAISY